MSAVHQTQTKKFHGFRHPTTTPVPDEIFDELLDELTGAEVKVLLYICRRTFGFKKDRDSISLNQISSGITTRDGRVLDRGTGLSKRHVQRALASLEEKNIIVTERVLHEEGTYETNVYSLKFENERNAPQRQGARGVGTLSPYGRDKSTLGVGTPVSTTTNSNTQETVTVNGLGFLLQKLPPLDEPANKIHYVAQTILETLGARDTHSKKFHYLVASRIPEKIIRAHLADIRADGAHNPAALFTYRIRKVVEERMDNAKYDVAGMTQKLSQEKTYKK